MPISQAPLRGWRRVRAAFGVSDRQTPLESACNAYRAEVDMAALRTHHAHCMVYLQFRAELLRIAAEVQAHLPWLQEQIRALGGNLPSSSPTLTLKRNSWECLRRDVEESWCGCVRLLQWGHRVEQEAPGLAAGLQRIRKDKLRHREEFRHMLMKSDPYTISTTGPSPDQDAHHKQA